MTEERVAELRGFYNLSGSVVRECLDEIERLQGEVKILQETPTGVALTHARRLQQELAALRAIQTTELEKEP